jgi:hypothetical protein
VAVDAATIARWRLANQLAPRSDPAAVVGRFAAVQGQDLLPSAWAVAQRCAGSVTASEVEDAYSRGGMLRTHVLRPTWHLCDPVALRWLLTATAPRVHQLNAPYYRSLGVDDAARRTLRDVLERVLPGEALTRTEVARHLAEAGVAAAGQRLAYLLMYAELEAIVVSGPMRGRQHTYSLFEERVPAADDEDRDAALARLATCYFTTRGPATVRDLAAWASLTIREAEQGRAAAGRALDSLEMEGRTYWRGAGDEPPPARESRTDLVQGLDELVMSYSDSRDLLTGGATIAAPETFYNPVLRDGRLAGLWRYERRGGSFVIQSRLLDDLHAAVTARAEEFSRFVEAPVTSETA